MTGLTTIVLLTIRETLRRRVVLVLTVLTLLFALGVGWGFDRLASIARESAALEAQVKVLVAQFLVMVMFMFSFIVGMTAVFVTSPTISGEVESGVMLSILARPVRREAVLLGKWLGSAIVVIAFAILGGAVLLAVVAWTTGYVPPSTALALAFLAGETLIGVTLAILLSTLVPPMAGGAVAVAGFGAVWIAGIAASIGQVLHNDSLIRVGTISQLLLPTDALWRGTVFHLEPTIVLAAGAGVAGNPFLSLSSPTPQFLAWCGVWTVVVLAGAMFVFRSREL